MDRVPASGAGTALLLVVDPNGNRTRVELKPVPFRIGRQADNHLILRDSRASRVHAHIVLESGCYIVEDPGSRHGVYVNGSRVDGRRALAPGDRIDFGFPDSYQAVFAPEGTDADSLAAEASAAQKPAEPPPGRNLAKLRAVLEVARTLQTSFSMDDVLVSVVDAALTVTSCERGFLLLRKDDELEIRVARDQAGQPLHPDDLRVPRRVIQRALQQRRELLSMSFEPYGDLDSAPDRSVADLELRSVVCVPLVRISASAANDTSMLSTANHTVGVLYMDSRIGAADLAGGNRELLQSLAIEASTVLENARLLEEERGKQKMEEELELARRIQQSLLPPALPETGWFRATGTNEPSLQVGGDYFDVIRTSDCCWAAVVADVSGKGVSSALLASLLQGAFLTVSEDPASMPVALSRLNRYLNERTGGGKYATILYCHVRQSGELRYVNAGHCAPLLVSRSGEWKYLEATAMPVGLLPAAEFPIEQVLLKPGDKIVAYSDGVSEAQNGAGEFFGRSRLRSAATAEAAGSSRDVHRSILSAVAGFTEGARQADDVTLVVLEYVGGPE